MSEEALKFLLNSAVLILLLLVLYFVVLKFNLGTVKRTGREIKVVDRYPLDREGSLLLFKVRDTTFLCCYSKGELKVLREWKDEKETADPSSIDTSAG